MIQRGPCIVMDVDGTLCPIKGSVDSYADLQPYRQMVDRLRELRAAGYYVISRPAATCGPTRAMSG
jgi:histidinol phosphatase-like enzyme